MLARLTTLALFATSCSFSGTTPQGAVDGGGEDGRIASVDAASNDAAVDAGTSLAACFSSYDDFAIGANKYEIIGNTTGLDYDTASDACEQDGGRLVVLEDGDENAAIAAELAARGVTAPACPDSLPCAWIGLMQTPGAFLAFENWQWSDQVDVGFRIEWQIGEPNDSGDIDGEVGDEDCAEVIVDDLFGGRWNDEACASGRPAVCECHSL